MRNGWWHSLGELTVARPRAVAGAVVGAALLAALVAALALRVKPGYVDLLDPDSPLQARYLKLLEELGNVEALHVVVQAEEPSNAARFVDAFGAEVEGLAGGDGQPLVADVLHRVDLAWFGDRLPAYLPPELLGALVAEAREPDSWTVRVATDPRPEILLGALRRTIASCLDDAGRPHCDESLGEGSDPVAALLESLLSAARSGDAPTAGALVGDLAARRSDGWLDPAGRVQLAPGCYLVTVTPVDVDNEFEALAAFLTAVRARGDALAGDLGVTVRYTGAPVLIVDEMRAARRDVTRSTLLALVLVSLLFFASFHSVRHVLGAAAALVCGLALTFGAAWVLVGSLNLFSVVFAAVLVGLGIDFGVHVVHRHETLLQGGASATEAIPRTLATVGPPTAIGALTTSAAFFGTGLSEFAGFSQLGIISGAGVLLCLACAVTLLPAVLVTWAQPRRDDAPATRLSTRRLSTARTWTARPLALALRRPGLTLTVGVVLIAIAAAGLLRLRFDYDLLNLQPGGTDAVALARGDDGLRISTHFAHCLAGDMGEARRLADELSSLPSVASVRSAASFLPTSPPALMDAELSALANALSDIAPREPLPTPDLAAIARELDELELVLLDAEDLAFEADRREELRGIARATAAIESLRGSLANRDRAMRGLAAFHASAVSQLRRLLAGLPHLESPSPADLPEGLASRLVGRSGVLAVLVEPAGSIWDRDSLEQFVADVRRVDPEVTGPPVQVLELTQAMRRSLEQAALLSALAITLLIAACTRSLTTTVLALSPVLVGFVLALGALGWLGVALNPANLIALPLLLGIGVDNGVHVAHRWLIRGSAAGAIGEVGHAIVVTSLTTVGGFCGLLVATHEGVHSLGVVACTGACAMLLASVVLLPAALALSERLTSAPDGAPSDDD